LKTFDKVVITEMGNQLITEAVSGKQIEFTRLVTGSGNYDIDEEITKMTALKEQRQEFQFSKIEKISESLLLLTAVISNRNLETSYHMTEVGIYGKVKESDKEVLYSVNIIDIEKADLLLPYNGLLPSEIKLNCYIAIKQDIEPKIALGDAIDVLLNEIDTMNAAIEDKVDKVDGKGLSTHDYTTQEKDKLKNIESGAGVNVQADWNVTDTEDDAYIKNRPHIPAKVSELENDSGFARTESPDFTGIPKAPTPDQGSNSTQIATTAFVKAIVNALVNGAPETLDTLGEIAEAFAENETVIEALNEAIGNKLGKKETAAAASKWETARNLNGLIIDGSSDRANYGTCSTAAATAAKTVDCAGFSLVTGAEITVRFTVTNTAANPTLNVGGTGARPVYYRGSAIAAGYLAANRTYIFRYNGTQWDLVGDVDTNSTYSLATSSARGLVKIGYKQNGKNYPVQLSDDEQMYVNVPWTDTNTWKANTADNEGYVAKGSGHANQVWKTDAKGVPGWHTDKDTTYSNMTGATASADGAHGLVPAPSKGKQTAFLRGDGTWVTPSTSLAGTVQGIPLDQTAGKALKDQLDKQNSNLSELNGSLNSKVYSALNSYITSAVTRLETGYVRRTGNICELQFTGTVKNSTSNAQYIPIINLPENYRGFGGIQSIAYGINQTGYLVIDSQVKIYLLANASATLGIKETYIATN